ncbi:unnamed protein product [Paramecium pentaurelia]|uniref:Uncharacterized protein n=1 Tax=Paramecium pentaurelia TaxID=43138 RepID=A0A8S1S6N4_9CILI|nr:unnamed protein product [Paramecium pentaurelia]
MDKQHKVTLQTHWEDNCEYYCQPETGFLFEDQKDQSQISNVENGNYQTKINIPEYYNYNGIINGDLQHISTGIDAKLYGNIDIDLSGDFSSQKIKSEICRVKANNLEINSALETQFGQLQIKNNVTIKKLLISKVTNLYQENVKFKQVMYKICKKIIQLCKNSNFQKILNRIIIFIYNHKQKLLILEHFQED